MQKSHFGLSQATALGRSKAWTAILFLTLIELAFASFGYEGRKIFQITALLIPVLLLLLVPIRTKSINIIRTVFVWCIFLIFIIDALIRTHIILSYDATPDSSMIIGAVANTSKEEIREYIFSHTRYFWGSISAILILAIVSFKLSQQGSRLRKTTSILHKIILFLIISLSIASYASKPWRRLNPIIFWSQFTESVNNTKNSWKTYDQSRKKAIDFAKNENPFIERNGRSTIVLIISESINRDNMSIYGYERETTPNLKYLKETLNNNFTVIKNSWSTEATTIPSLDSMMNFKSSASKNTLNLIALAKTAGYKTWWISNHDDIAISKKIASFADVVAMENNKPGRSSNSLDEVLIPSYDNALKDTYPHKMIILHMLGAHPHYRLRFPSGQTTFREDKITERMIAANRPSWVRKFRDEYDSAILYQDRIVSTIFDKAASANISTDEFRSVFYISDHGQEVGHSTNKIGHSPTTESGYKIPAILWVSDDSVSTVKNLSDRSFRTDWLAWTVSDLLSLKWNDRDPSKSIFSDNYIYTRPDSKFSGNTHKDYGNP